MKTLDQKAFDFVMNSHEEGKSYGQILDVLWTEGYRNKKGAKLTTDSLGSFMRKKGYTCKYRNFQKAKSHKEIGNFNFENFKDVELENKVDAEATYAYILESNMPKKIKLKILEALL